MKLSPKRQLEELHMRNVQLKQVAKRWQDRGEYLLKFMKEKVDPEISRLSMSNLVYREALEKAQEELHEVSGNGGPCSYHKLKDCPIFKDALGQEKSRSEKTTVLFQALFKATQKVLIDCAQGNVPKDKKLSVWVVEELVGPVRRLEESRDMFTKMKPKDPGQELMKKKEQEDEADPAIQSVMERAREKAKRGDFTDKGKKGGRR